MKLCVEHEIRGRIRLSTSYGRLTAHQGDMLLYYLLSLPGVEGAKVYERSGDGVVCYRGNREDLLSSIVRFSLEDTDICALVPEHTSRKLTDEYANKLASRVILRVLTRILLPAPARAVWACLRSFSFLRHGFRCLRRGRLEVPVLDAVAIGASLLRRDFDTASPVQANSGSYSLYSRSEPLYVSRTSYAGLSSSASFPSTVSRSASAI